MPRTVDHIVETHQLAQQRRAAGRPVWDRRVSLADVFHNEDMTFEARRDAIVARIRASAWFKSYGSGDELHLFVEELADAADGDEFDGPWDCIYDIADIDRVWIATC